MLTYVDTGSGVPVYIQVENHIRFAIASGRLKAGDLLPSVRDLSKRLSVNTSTIAKAYHDLEVQGLLYKRSGTGSYVAKGVEARCREECCRYIASRLHEVVGEAKAAGINAENIMKIVRQSMETDSGLYGKTPGALNNLARAAAKAKVARTDCDRVLQQNS